MNIFLIHHRSPHHATTSGYGRLIDYLEAKVVYGTSKLPFRLAKVVAGFHSQVKGAYNVGSVLKAFELYHLLKKNRKEQNIVHFLNGERDIRHLGFFKKRFPNTRFVATFHKPPEILEKTIPNPTVLRKLDGAIAVGINQVDFLKDWLQLEHVVYIPHGVDTHFFIPSVSNKKENTLLFVGQHLRDFDTFNKSVPRLAEKIKNLRIQVIIHPAYASKIEPHEYITIFTDVKDAQLLAYYQEATVLYLPMLNSTACNSLLEAMATGLPIVTSDVGGNTEYLTNTSNVLLENCRVDDFVIETVALLQDELRLKDLSKRSREKALEFDWKVITERILDFYKESNPENV